MGLDSRYVLAPSLQEYFVDKDNGLPLVNGQVFFWKDDQRTIPKDVFELSGSPPNYSYTLLPNPSFLSSVGTFQDASGNDILPYWYPFDDDGNIELYYIEVFDQNGVLQFTREGWPNTTAGGSGGNGDDVANHIPNGQFLLHNNSIVSDPLTGSQVASTFNYGGTIGILEVYQIAQGGWTFERSNSSTAVDAVTFPRFDAAITSPSGNPRYAVQIQTTVAGTDTNKDLALKFPDVNKFASNTQFYNLYFEAESVTGSDVNNVQIFVRKYFGTGGVPSATTETEITTINLIAGSYQSYNIPILFGTNESKTLGTNNDDFMQIVIRLPVTGVQTVAFTDFVLRSGETELTAFPSQTNAEQLDESTAGWLPTPNPDGSDLYLPIRLTPSGMEFDHTVVGKIVASALPGAQDGELFCDGSGYITSEYSSIGIPYSRLQRVLNPVFGSIPIYGTSPNFISSQFWDGVAAGDILAIGTNKPLAVTAASAQNSGFTITPIAPTGFAGCGAKIYLDGYTNLILVSNVVGNGAVPVPVDNTGGDITFTSIYNRNVNGTFYVQGFNMVGTPAAAEYVNFSTPSGNFFFWFKVNGAGSVPAGTGTAIEVDITTPIAGNFLAASIYWALNGNQAYNITVTAGSAIVPGHYWTFSADVEDYYVWYRVNGIGNDPAPSGIGLRVDVLSTDTANDVADKTDSVINEYSFAVPDLRGAFLRGVNANSGKDPEILTRYNPIPIYTAGIVGSYQLDANQVHFHAVDPPGNFLNNANNTAIYDAGAFGELSPFTTDVGLSDSRPYNAAVNFLIKY